MLSWFSAVQQCKSATVTYVAPPSAASLPPHPIPLGPHRAPAWAPCVTQRLPAIYFTRDSVHLSALLSQFIPPSPSLAVSTSLFSTRFISAIFLDSICICLNIGYSLFSFWHTSLCVRGSRFIQFTTTDSNPLLFMANINRIKSTWKTQIHSHRLWKVQICGVLVKYMQNFNLRFINPLHSRILK